MTTILHMTSVTDVVGCDCMCRGKIEIWKCKITEDSMDISHCI